MTKAARVRLTHHIVELDDGRRVGLSVGGQGVPLVFMHALLLSRRAYLRVLSRIAGQGFLVIAVDAAGHGDTRQLPANACSFTDRAEAVLRTLDALGVGQAVLAGHSMGGRMAIHLAARAPERVLAAVLFDPAAGAHFDHAMPKLVKSPAGLLGAVSTAFRDTLGDPLRMKNFEQVGYLRRLASVATPNLLHPRAAFRTIKAIVESGDYTPMLNTMRDEGMPTMVLHAEKDLIVPFTCAHEVATDADGSLYRVPSAHHSWMIADPRQGGPARSPNCCRANWVRRFATPPTPSASPTSTTTRPGSASYSTATRCCSNSSAATGPLKSARRNRTTSTSSRSAARSARTSRRRGHSGRTDGGPPTPSAMRGRRSATRRESIPTAAPSDRAAAAPAPIAAHPAHPVVGEMHRATAGFAREPNRPEPA